MATVFLPTPLRKYSNGAAKVQAQGATLGDVIDNLEQSYPGLRARLYDETGEFKRFIQIFVNDEDARSLQGAATPIGERDEVSIVPAMAGGQNP
jgi:sulfur-carrier protein